MVDMAKVHQHMSLPKAMFMYSTPDKEKFICSYPQYQEKRPESTFYADFSVADVYGIKAIKDTYMRCFKGWKENVKMFTEFTAMLNHKLWYWYQCGVNEYSELYDQLWKKADAYGCEHFKGDDATYFFSVLD